MDKIILGVSSLTIGIGMIVGSYILFPPPTLPKLTAVFCTTMANIPPDYNNIMFTLIGVIFVVVGIFIASFNWWSE